VDRRKYRELWASTPRGHLLLPTPFFAKPLHTVIDRVSLCTSSKSRRKTRRARMPACPVAPAPASRLKGAPEPPRSPWPRLPSPVSWLRASPEPPRASWFQLPPPGPGAALGPPCASWAPAPSSWLRVALEQPRVPWVGSMSRELLK
jgi:hypothetical protein